MTFRREDGRITMRGFIICTSVLLLVCWIKSIRCLINLARIRGQCIRYSDWKSWRSSPFGRPKFRWEGNIKVNLEEAEWEVFGLYLHYLAEVRGQFDRIAPRISHVRCHSNPLQFIICHTVRRCKHVSLTQWQVRKIKHKTTPDIRLIINETHAYFFVSWLR